MAFSPDNFYYTGIPQQTRDPDKWKKPLYSNLEKANDASLYVAPHGLRDAVNVALELGLPLLLTGEPSVGKSSLARSLNLELGYQDRDLLHFTVKSETREGQLVYSYDTLGRFHAVHGQINIPDEQAKLEADPRRFFRYQGLGVAIRLDKGQHNIPARIMTDDVREHFPETPRRTVVLIDEIDKAPRDMPNDFLNEIERMEFRIPELFINEPIRLETDTEKRHRPIEDFAWYDKNSGSQTHPVSGKKPRVWTLSYDGQRVGMDLGSLARKLSKCPRGWIGLARKRQK